MLCRFRIEGIYYENIDIRIVINFIEKKLFIISRV